MNISIPGQPDFVNFAEIWYTAGKEKSMEDIIKQFLALPPTVRLAVSSPQAIDRLERIEARYNVKLADIVIRVIIKQMPLTLLSAECEHRFKLSGQLAKELADDLISEIFSQASSHLGFNPAGGTRAVSANPVHDGSLGEIHKDPDVVMHTQKLKYEPPQQVVDAKLFAKQIISDLHLPLPDEVVHKRFMLVVESRLVDARTSEETKDRLVRDSKIGGLGLDAMTAHAVSMKIEEAYNRIHQQHLKVKADDVLPRRSIESPKPPQGPLQHPDMPLPRPQVAPATPLSSAPASHNVPYLPVQPKSGIAQPSISPKPVTGVPMPPPPAPPQLESLMTPSAQPTQQVTPRMQAATKIMPRQAPSGVQFHPRPVAKAEPSRDQTRSEAPHFMPKMLRPDQSSGRPTMSDITPARKLIGPVEEMSQMTIQDFRKLGGSPEASADRMRQIIKLLEQESLDKKSAGVKSWRSSPMMREYLEIGSASMESNTTVEAVIEQRKIANPQSMTKTEFDTVALLNRSLRY